jgi:hypothetical protein
MPVGSEMKATENACHYSDIKSPEPTDETSSRTRGSVEHSD